MNRIAAARIIGAALLSNGLAATVSVPAAAASAPVSVDTSTNGVVISPDVATAVARDLGLSPGRAMVAFAHPDRVDALVATLRTLLRPIFAGFSRAALARMAVAAVTELTAFSRRCAAGVEARVVTRMDARLTVVAAGLRQKQAPAVVVGWSVDLPTDHVAAHVVDHSPATEACLSGDDAAVRADTMAARPRPLYAVRGGHARAGSNFRRVIGFGLGDAVARQHFVTSGRRTAASGTTFGYDQFSLGRISAYGPRLVTS